MLQITSSPGTLVAMSVSGQITGKDMDTVIKAVEAALLHNERVSLYAEVEKSISFTAEAFFKDLRYGFSKLRELKRFYRAAVITNNKWLATLVRVEGLVFSQIEIKVFPTSEREAAINWASERAPLIELPKETKQAIRMLETDKPNVVAFEIDGQITMEDVNRVIDIFRPILKNQEKICVLGRFKNYRGFDFNAVAQDSFFSFKTKTLSKVERYAVVGAPVWLENFIELLNPLFETEMKCFSSQAEDEAWAWLELRHS